MARGRRPDAEVAARRERVLDLWASGKSSREISDELRGALRPNSVCNVVAAARDRGDPRAVERASGKDLTSTRTNPELSEETRYGLSAEARRRGVAQRRLVADLLGRVVADDLFRAIIDDE